MKKLVTIKWYKVMEHIYSEGAYTSLFLIFANFRLRSQFFSGKKYMFSPQLNYSKDSNRSYCRRTQYSEVLNMHFSDTTCSIFVSFKSSTRSEGVLISSTLPKYFSTTNNLHGVLWPFSFPLNNGLYKHLTFQVNVLFGRSVVLSISHLSETTAGTAVKLLLSLLIRPERKQCCCDTLIWPAEVTVATLMGTDGIVAQ